MAEELKLETYCEPVNETSRSLRSTLVVLATAFVVVFAAFWNFRETLFGFRNSNWTSERLRLAQNALERYERLDQLPEEDQARHRQFLKLNTVHSKQDLRKLIDGLQETSRQMSIIRIPVFHVAFDVNDLGMLGGFAFMVILMMFRLSLQRNIESLLYAFAQAARQNQFLDCHDLLSLKDLFKLGPGDSLWGGLRSQPLRLLLVLPVVAQTLVFWNDACTAPYSWVISTQSTLLVLGTGVFFLALLGFLTWSCFRLLAKHDAEWEKAGKAVAAIKAGGTAAPGGLGG